MAFQAWKIVSRNSMTFHNPWGSWNTQPTTTITFSSRFI